MTIVAVALLCVLVLLVLESIEAAQEKKVYVNSRGWRIRFVGGGFLYEENGNGKWEGIKFEWADSRDQPGVVVLPSSKAWSRVPSWTNGRRDEIIYRINSELKTPRFVISES